MGMHNISKILPIFPYAVPGELHKFSIFTGVCAKTYFLPLVIVVAFKNTPPVCYRWKAAEFIAGTAAATVAAA
jgi:hypothetical protein